MTAQIVGQAFPLAGLGQDGRQECLPYKI